METLYYLGLVQSGFTALLVGFKKDKSLSEIILLLWLLLIATDMSFLLFPVTFLEQDHLRVLAKFTFLLLYGPSLYFYTKTVIDGKSGFRKTDLLNFCPVLFLFLSLLFISPEGFSKTYLPGLFFKPGPNQVLKIIWSSLLVVSWIYSSVGSFLLIRNYALRFTDNFSNKNASNNLRWLKIVNFIFLGGLIPVVIIGIASLVLNVSLGFSPLVFISASLILLTYSISYWGISQPSLFHPSLMERNEIEIGNEKASFNLSAEEIKGFTKKLYHFLDSEKLYLNPELTLQELADHIGIQKYNLTKILNRTLNKNFYHLINDYRVEEAMSRLKNKKYKHLTVIAIGFDSGFNSKSTFNSFFKQSTGLTPSEYRKQAFD